MVAIGSIDVLALFALMPKYFSWTGVFLCLFLFWLSIWIGIGVGYHRLFTHQSFKTTTRVFRYMLAIAGTLSWEGGPIVWVGRHRIHHRYADQEGDPHSPIHGLDWAHMLWIMFRTTKQENEQVWKMTPDLQKDRGMVLINRFFWISQVVLAVTLFMLGLRHSVDTAWSWVIWGVGVRTFLGHHITWMVNSITHMWGYRNFPTRDLSTNNLFVALLTWGEGWHNNHHADPTAACHGGRRKSEIDLTYITIKFFSFLGLAKDIVPIRVWRKIES